MTTAEKMQSGPYTYHRDKDGCNEVWVISEPGGRPLVSIPFWDRADETEADAKLIVAALNAFHAADGMTVTRPIDQIEEIANEELRNVVLGYVTAAKGAVVAIDPGKYGDEIRILHTNGTGMLFHYDDFGQLFATDLNREGQRMAESRRILKAI
jgi:hypothetical protein